MKFSLLSVVLLTSVQSLAASPAGTYFKSHETSDGNRLSYASLLLIEDDKLTTYSIINGAKFKIEDTISIDDDIITIALNTDAKHYHCKGDVVGYESRTRAEVVKFTKTSTSLELVNNSEKVVFTSISDKEKQELLALPDCVELN